LKNLKKTKTECNWYKSDRIDIAIHIRKGDVIEWNITTRITPNEYFINVAKQLNSILKNQKKNIRFQTMNQM
jgi:cell division septal protein FtsQ